MAIREGEKEGEGFWVHPSPPPGPSEERRGGVEIRKCHRNLEHTTVWRNIFRLVFIQGGPMEEVRHLSGNRGSKKKENFHVFFFFFFNPKIESGVGMFLFKIYKMFEFVAEFLQNRIDR